MQSSWGVFDVCMFDFWIHRGCCLFGVWVCSFGLVGGVFLYVKVRTPKKKKKRCSGSVVVFNVEKLYISLWIYWVCSEKKPKAFVYMKEEKQLLLGLYQSYLLYLKLVLLFRIKFATQIQLYGSFKKLEFVKKMALEKCYSTSCLNT